MCVCARAHVCTSTLASTALTNAARLWEECLGSVEFEEDMTVLLCDALAIFPNLSGKTIETWGNSESVSVEPFPGHLFSHSSVFEEWEIWAEDRGLSATGR